MKAVAVLTFTLGVVTWILCFPSLAPLGTTSLILLAVSLVIVPAAPFEVKLTELAPRRSAPLMVTTVPGGPLVGVHVVMVFHWAVRVTGLPPLRRRYELPARALPPLPSFHRTKAWPG